MYIVTRQAYWPDGQLVVEIARGGIDYCNPDALVPKYPGEFQEFKNPKEAVQVALKILELWKTDYTCGMTIPFEPVSEDELFEWAHQEYKEVIYESPASECIGF